MYLAQLEREVLNSGKFHISGLITMIKEHAEVVNDTLFQRGYWALIKTWHVFDEG